MSSESTPTKPEIHYPSSEGTDNGKTEAHVRTIANLLLTVLDHFRERSDVYVIGDMFWYYEEGSVEKRCTPDLMVVKGAKPGPPKGRMCWRSWVEEVTPCFVLEIISELIPAEDLNTRLQLYRELGVSEYFLFDSRRECPESRLRGFRLLRSNDNPSSRNDETLPLEGDGWIFSRELGLRLTPQGQVLRAINPSDQISESQMKDLVEHVRTMKRESAVLRASEAAKLRELERKTEFFRQLADAEQLRADKFLAEIEELRRRFPPRNN